jgi:hypothetical protein
MHRCGVSISAAFVCYDAFLILETLAYFSYAFANH